MASQIFERSPSDETRSLGEARETPGMDEKEVEVVAFLPGAAAMGAPSRHCPRSKSDATTRSTGTERSLTGADRS